MKNIRGQIGETITWIPAFLIIFFMIVLFISASVGLAKDKFVVGKVKSFVGKIQEFVTKPYYEVDNYGVDNRMRLLVFLDSYTEKDKEKIQIRDLICLDFIENYDLIKKSLLEFMNSLEPKPECYILEIINLDSPNSKRREIAEIKGKLKSRGSPLEFLEYNGVSLKIFSGEGLIKLDFYSGKCL